MCMANVTAVIQELHDNLEIERANNKLIGEALAKLVVAAREVVDIGLHEDYTSNLENLLDKITDLQEAIPCDDCICAPCRCPN